MFDFVGTGDGVGTGRLAAPGGLDVRVKVLLVALVLWLIALAPNGWFPAVVVILSFGGLYLLGRARILRRRLAPALAFAGILALTRTFFQGGEPLFTLDLHGFVLVAYRDGLGLGLTLLVRVVAGVGLLTLLNCTTDFPGLIGGLRRLGLPATLAELLVLTFRYVFVLGDEARRMREAATVRLGFANWRLGLSSAGALAGMVLWRACDRSENVYRAMVARGYSGAVPVGIPGRVASRDLLAGAAGAFLMLALFLLSHLV